MRKMQEVKECRDCKEVSNMSPAVCGETGKFVNRHALPTDCPLPDYIEPALVQEVIDRLKYYMDWSSGDTYTKTKVIMDKVDKATSKEK